MTANKPLFTLYSRDYCHLCHDMLDALEVLRAEHGRGFEIEVIDVDADPALSSRYDELVPVLVVMEGADARELCHYFLDTRAVLDYLVAFGGTRAAIDGPSQGF